MKDKYKKYIEYIARDIELPYIKYLEPYGLKQDEMDLVLSKVFNQPVTIKGRDVYNTNNNGCCRQRIIPIRMTIIIIIFIITIIIINISMISIIMDSIIIIIMDRFLSPAPPEEDDDEEEAAALR